MNKYSFIVRRSYESNFDDLCFVNPCEEYFVTLSNKTELAVWECVSGTKVYLFIININMNLLIPLF